ncbi:glycine-rich domain-containing protein [Acidocella sp.]|uniref:glycine-rich domain-containing protein n=1 Tax=Acidocella sp. TaxID=50710 RepID=UPI002610B575|nr:hypothetical protein [Acidocella sp.]
MDRNIVYPGSIPLDTDILFPNRSAMIGIAALTAATLGTGVVVDGLVCTPTNPASMTVVVGPGSITQLSAVDTSAYGSLAADVADQIVKTGINLQSTSFTLTAPSTSGLATNYLIEAAFSEEDAVPVVLPYVNAANPTQAFSGPDNAGTAQNTRRIQRVQLQVKPGTPAAAGTQTTPAVDVGWVGLYVVTLNYGQTAVTASSIAVAPGAPFLAYKLPNLRPGFSTMQVFNASGSFVVPNGVTSVKVEVVGGGGGGGYHQTMPGGGGGAGGRSVGVVTNLVPGAVIPVTVGAGGAVLGSFGNGNNGGASSFGSYMTANGGVGGNGGTQTGLISNAGGPGGTASGGQLNVSGSYGTDAIIVAYRGGDGGGPGNGRGTSGPIVGIGAVGVGGGGGGGGCSTGASPTGYPGGAGAPGVVIVHY